MRHRAATLASVALFWTLAIALMIGVGMLRAMAPPPFAALVWGAASSLALFALTLLFLRRERRDTGDVGLRVRAGSLPRFAAGLVVGGAMYGMHLLVLVGIAGVRIGGDGARGVGALGLALLTYLALSLMEEIGFRGWALRRLEDTVGRAPAILIGALAFVLLHLAYGWPPGQALLGAGSGALVFGTAALATRGLAVPVGVHLAWNLADWSVGQKDTPGPWRLLTAGANPDAASIGTASYLVVMGLALLGLWLVGRRPGIEAAPTIG